ncbi:MAG: cysteine desulfurase [Chloroflexi bacterium]|nr:cysteine desulfurase [Chloroflexota bacterium]
MKTIYADYQASTPIDPRVLEAMTDYWRNGHGNPHSIDHIVGWRAAQDVEKASEIVARVIGADADEIVFTSGATEANNLALTGLARRASPDRNRILVSAIEHKCVLETARMLSEREGYIVGFIPVDHEGFVILDALEDMLDETVLLASVMAVNNEIGTIQDIATVAASLAPYGTLLHCDATQAPCAMDTGELTKHADLISLSAHKFYGPQGIGALYVRRDLQSTLEPLMFGGGQQNGLRAGTIPVPLCVGMAAAANIAMSPEQVIERRRVACLRNRFVSFLEDSGTCLEINGHWGNRRHPGNANIRFTGQNAADILAAVQPRIAASVGAACASGITESSHVLRAIGLSTAAADASIRFSFGRFSTDEEAEESARFVTDALFHLNAS